MVNMPSVGEPPESKTPPLSKEAMAALDAALAEKKDL
jgi:hypothetical protein